MTKRDIVSLAMKIIGVYYLVQVVPFAFSLLVSRDIIENPLSAVVAAGILIVGLLLVFGSGAIANFIVPQKEESAVASALSPGDWQAVSFSALGVYTVIQALRSVSIFFYPKHNLQWPTIISGIVMLVIGVLLFVQARGLANLWQFIQEHRSNENEES